jgi:hypothetical protein
MLEHLYRHLCVPCRCLLENLIKCTECHKVDVEGSFYYIHISTHIHLYLCLSMYMYEHLYIHLHVPCQSLLEKIVQFT